MKPLKLLTYVGLTLQALLYIGGGINHFINPGFYIPLIPDYIPFKPEVNFIAGGIEIILGAGLLLWAKHRKYFAYGIIILLILFLPAHIHHLLAGGCLDGSMCIPIWACIIRIIFQFVLILWAWSVRKFKVKDST